MKGRWSVGQELTYGRTRLLAATDPETDEHATVQVFGASRNAKERLQRTAEALRALSHPSLPVLLEEHDEADEPFLVFEPFTADAMSDRMVEGNDWKLACTWLHGIAVSLQYLHAEGWAHRGLTPESVFVGARNEIYLLGLGAAAKDHRQRARLPMRNMAYVAPEVLQTSSHDPVRADLYAFGCLAYELFTGQPAFPASTWGEQPDPRRMLLEWKVDAEPLDPGSQHPDWVRTLVMKCTHPLADHRLPDIGTVVAWLEGARSSWEIGQRVATPMALPRGLQPKLRLTPQKMHTPAAPAVPDDAAELAERQIRRRHDVYVMTAAAIGCGLGVAAAALNVLWLELSAIL